MNSWWVWVIVLGYIFLGVDSLRERLAQRRFSRQLMSRKPLVPDIWARELMK